MFQLFAEITECRCITITRLVDRLIGEISSLKRGYLQVLTAITIGFLDEHINATS